MLLMKVSSSSMEIEDTPKCKLCKTNDVREKRNNGNIWKLNCCSCNEKTLLKAQKNRFKNLMPVKKQTYLFAIDSVLPFTDVMFIPPERFTGRRAEYYRRHKECTEKLRVFVDNIENDSSIDLAVGSSLYKDTNNDYYIFMKCVCCNQMQVRTPLMFEICSEDEQQNSALPGLELLLNTESRPCRRCGRKYTDAEYLPLLLRSYPLLSKEWAISEMNNCNNKCYITGLTIRFQPGSASINAKVNKGVKNSKESHTPENSELVHWYTNIRQGTAITIIKQAWKYLSLMVKDDISNADTFKNENQNMVLRQMIQNSIAHDVRRGFVQKTYYENLNETDMQGVRKENIIGKIYDEMNELLIEQQKGKCARSGLNMTIFNGATRFSIDRIDNDLPHFTVDTQNNVYIGNCRIIMRIFNTARGHFTADEITFGLQFNRDDLALELQSDKDEVERIDTITCYNDRKKENYEDEIVEKVNCQNNIINEQKKIIEQHKNLLFEQQKIIATQQKANDKERKNHAALKKTMIKKISDQQALIDRLFSTVGSKLIVGTNTTTSTSASAVESKLIVGTNTTTSTSASAESNVEHNLLSTTTPTNITKIIGPLCQICHKKYVTEKHKSNNRWKTKCSTCLLSRRTMQQNRKRQRLEQ